MNNKDYSISIIRLISMIMIISCHILQGLNNNFAFWINTGVQLFFFVSGFLYGKKKISNIKEFYKKRMEKILFPYIIVFIISLLLEFVLLKRQYSLKKIFGCIIGFGGFTGNISILSHTWFVSYILLCYILVPVLQILFKTNKFKKNFMYFLIFMFFMQLFQEYGIVNIEISWINNFIIGYFYSKCCKTIKQDKTFVFFIFISFLLIIPYAIIYQEKIPILLPNIFNLHAKFITNYGHVMLGSVLFIILYKTINKFNIKNNIILSFSDKYSYYIYLVHQIFILNSFSVLFLTKNLFINIVLIILFSIFFAFIIKKLCDILLVGLKCLCNKCFVLFKNI